jgi:hypothetical protein
MCQPALTIFKPHYRIRLHLYIGDQISETRHLPCATPQCGQVTSDLCIYLSFVY